MSPVRRRPRGSEEDIGLPGTGDASSRELPTAGAGTRAQHLGRAVNTHGY